MASEMVEPNLSAPVVVRVFRANIATDAIVQPQTLDRALDRSLRVGVQSITRQNLKSDQFQGEPIVFNFGLVSRICG